MYLKPQVATRLIAALIPLSKEVECEIEQRKTSGNDESWLELDALHGTACEAISEASRGHGELSPIQARLLASYDDGTQELVDLHPRDLVSHEDGLIHFLLSEVSDCDSDDPESVAEARDRLHRAAAQVLQCADALDRYEAEVA